MLKVSLISATTALAPEAARKALEKGQEQQQKGKLDDAQKSLEKAVAMYPSSAAAWFELGRVQLQKKRSCQRAHILPAIARSRFEVRQSLPRTHADRQA